MASFLATYQASSGKARQMRVEATDLLDAKRQLRRRGILATKLEASPTTSSVARNANRAPTASFNWQQLLEAKPGIRDKALFANKLAALVDAGVPIVRSLDLMAAQQTKPLFKRALKSLSSEVNQGGSMGAAMRLWPQVFDKLTIAMVEAGEAGG